MSDRKRALSIQNNTNTCNSNSITSTVNLNMYNSYSIFNSPAIIDIDLAWDCKQSGDRLVNLAKSRDVDPPITVLAFFKKWTTHHNNKLALTLEKLVSKEKYINLEYIETVTNVAKAFLKLGLESLPSVCIISSNRPERYFSHLGAIEVGGIAVGLSTEYTPEIISYYAQDCRANFLIVENKELLVKVLKIRGEIPQLKAIIYCDEYPEYPDEYPDIEEKDVYSWKSFLDLGKTTHEDALIARQKSRGRSNVLMQLSQVNTLMDDIYVCFNNGAAFYIGCFAQCESHLVKILKEVRPTIFYARPYIWEKLYEKINDAKAEKSTKILKKIVYAFRNPRKRVGLDRCHACYSTGEPISQHIIDGFKEIDLPIWDCHGMKKTFAQLWTEKDILLAAGWNLRPIPNPVRCYGPL